MRLTPTSTRPSVPTLLLLAVATVLLAAPAQAQLGGQLGVVDRPSPETVIKRPAPTPSQQDPADAQPDRLIDDAPQGEGGAVTGEGRADPRATAMTVTDHTMGVLAGTVLGGAAGVLALGALQIGLAATSLALLLVPNSTIAPLGFLFGAGFFLSCLATPVVAATAVGIGAFSSGGKLWWVPMAAGLLAGAVGIPLGAVGGFFGGFFMALPVERAIVKGEILTGFMSFGVAVSLAPVAALLASGALATLAAGVGTSAELLTPLFSDDIVYGDE
jgi:hypothetical protein